MACGNGRDQRRGGNPGRPRSLLSRHASGGGLVPDRVVARSLPGQHSHYLDRDGYWRLCPTGLDALGAAALPTAVHRVGLQRLFEHTAEECREFRPGVNQLKIAGVPPDPPPVRLGPRG